jgi:hypothetical protein
MRSARICLRLTLAWLPLFWGCGDSGAATASQRTISGEVRDAQSGHGIGGAVVEFSSDTLETAETSTDGDGHFSLEVEVGEGVLFGHVSARHRDYESAAAVSVYFDGTENVLDIELQRKPSK